MKNNPTDRIAEIIIHHLDGSITKGEQKELNDWMGLFPENAEAVVEFLDEKKLQAGIKDMYQHRQKVWKVVQRQINTAKIVSLDHSSRHRKTSWLRIAAAAAIFLFLAGSIYFLFINKGSDPSKPTIAQNTDIEAPKYTRAMITLADGRVIAVDSFNAIAQGGVQVTKNENGELVYSGNNKDVIYNTLINPRGSKVVALRLNDGTKVWLNSESSLKYPVAFSGATRNVEITGEAYFEVAKDVSRKFLVASKGVVTEVLGTHFNVNAYSDEADIKVTLLEGSVEVKSKNSKLKINPGQQAKVLTENIQISNVDVQQVMAWKNGLFDFESNDLASVMRQIGRWYGSEIEYDGVLPEKSISGQVSRNVNVSEVISMIEQTGRVQFRIEGNKIIVKAK